MTVQELCNRESFASDHNRRGILALVGPGVKPGARVDGTVEDVAPTALYALGFEIPESLEGRVLLDAFDPEWLQRNPPHFRPGAMRLPDDLGEIPEEEALLDERLRELGYVR